MQRRVTATAIASGSVSPIVSESAATTTASTTVPTTSAVVSSSSTGFNNTNTSNTFGTSGGSSGRITLSKSKSDINYGSSSSNTISSRLFSIVSFVTSTQFLLITAAILTIITWMLPHHDIATLEKEVIAVEQNAERLFIETKAQQYINNNNNNFHNNNGHSSSDNNSIKDSMTVGSSSINRWVDGEKKLKKELLKLMELQKQGLELGVPVLTRWLGDFDIPAWAGIGVNVDEWQSRVTDAYKQMDDEEQIWKQHVQQVLEQRKK